MATTTTTPTADASTVELPTTSSTSAAKFEKLPPPESYSEEALNEVFTAFTNITAFVKERADLAIDFARVTFTGMQERYGIARGKLRAFAAECENIPDDEDVVSIAGRLSQIEGAPDILAKLDQRQRMFLQYGEQYAESYAAACEKIVDPADPNTVLLPKIAPTMTGLYEHITFSQGIARAKKGCEAPVWKHGRRIDAKIPATAKNTPAMLLAACNAAAKGVPTQFVAAEFTQVQLQAIGTWCLAAAAAMRGSLKASEIMTPDGHPIQ